ncbi:hypothetical protein AAVH_21996 [Aphelenchoides avenae]|nr:hypothetical protein AAVH_21996 [Aphelenchus avenae]
MTGISSEVYNKHYKTWFEAREECAKLGAKLVSVHDQATHEKLLQLIDANEVITNPEETTWIGLQVGRPHNVTYQYIDGEEQVVYETGCYWPAEVCPRLMEDDPDPNNTVDKCSITYDATFRGQWEDGKMYDKAESADFWAPGEPSNESKERCQGVKFNVDEQSQDPVSGGAPW